MDATAPSGMPSQQPQRWSYRKRPKERVRVTRACDHCKRQKIRCTGKLPCEVCVKKGNRCSYDAFYARGRAPSIVWDNSAGSTTSPEDSQIRKPSTEAPDRPSFIVDAISPNASPEPCQTDLQGHYVGPASGASFLIRIQKRVFETLKLPQNSSIFTFGDAPLPDVDTSFFLLPPREDTKKLLDKYFDFAVPTHRYLHKPTVEAWFEELYAMSGNVDSTDEARARAAVLFMVFAQASLYMPASVSSDAARTDSSARYFLVAEQQLKKERGRVRLASIQARLAQCFYLLSRSRINHCWSLFGTTAHLALAIGLNRGTRMEASGTGKIENECRRRVFWCAYTLDKYLAASLGRPRTFREEDIDQPLPSCIDDPYLSSIEIQTEPSQGQPVMVAAIAHAKLARVIDQILRDLYPIWPMTMSSRLKLTSQCSEGLKGWRKELEDFLDPCKIKTALLIPIFQRQRNVLNAAYWHATILTYRPLLLEKLGNARGASGLATEITAQATEVEEGIEECLQAALNICELVNTLINTEMMFKAFWFTSYYAFCAVVVLYVYTIQMQTYSSAQSHQKYLSVAVKCQTQLSAIAEEGSLTQRYCLVLEELRKEAVKGSEIPPMDFCTGASNENTSLQRELIQQEIIAEDNSAAMQHDTQEEDMTDATGLRTTLGSSVYDISGWGAFDSMVTSGFGNMEDLLGNESFF